MKTAITALAIMLAPTLALAGGTHSGGHGHQEGMAVGKPAETSPTRTVKVVMKEDYEGENVYIFDQKELIFSAGETVRLHIVNEGEEVHEFVMDTMHANAEHKEMMARFPEMEHDDPNAVRLEPGEEAEILWTFANPGTFEFACLLPGHYEGGMHGALVVN
ncbi:cupredoxin domain-containing protein [Ruegeria aquimaris]|uniref:Cupredoxin family protein n=1 Tax=Ruegeria aquimaris TaxID=2984333 RepID=A0ABT3ARJ9_9RHOB|nr:cupredoxin family protein [Ruegeria sp. XHP0148]MCV2891315.1 cupredoxin family protein [Ruegeria sp. XHP0148]